MKALKKLKELIEQREGLLFYEEGFGHLIKDGNILFDVSGDGRLNKGSEILNLEELEEKRVKGLIDAIEYPSIIYGE